MDEVIKFETKTFDQRLREFQSVLHRSGDNLYASQLDIIWSSYLENVIALCDWQAVWKVSRFDCELLNANFPTFFLVNVEEIDFAHLSATVSVLAVQEQIEIAENNQVNLIDLWPTQLQCHNKCSEEIRNIADALDMLRFFYTHLLMPWDMYENEHTVNWADDYLEQRLAFYYDIREIPCRVPYPMMEKINDFIGQVGYTNSKIKYTFQREPDNVNELARLLIVIEEMKREYAQISNSSKREIFIEALFPDWQSTILIPSFYVVSDEYCNLEERLDFLQDPMVEMEIGDYSGKIMGNLQSALQILKPVDTILLTPKTHYVERSAALEFGGTLKGVAGKDTSLTKITTNDFNQMFIFSGKNILLENLTLELGNANYCALIKTGCTRIVNCHIIGNGADQVGILVSGGARLEISNSTINGVKCAIKASAESEVVLRDCKIENVGIGVHAIDNASVNLKGCSIMNVFYGICLETDIDDAMEFTGEYDSIDVLQSIPNINVESSTIKAAAVKSVLIREKESFTL